MILGSQKVGDEKVDFFRFFGSKPPYFPKGFGQICKFSPSRKFYAGNWFSSRDPLCARDIPALRTSPNVRMEPFDSVSIDLYDRNTPKGETLRKVGEKTRKKWTREKVDFWGVGRTHGRTSGARTPLEDLYLTEEHHSQRCAGREKKPTLHIGPILALSHIPVLIRF